MNSLMLRATRYAKFESHLKTKKVFRILLLSFFLFNTLYMMTAFDHFFGNLTFGLVKSFDRHLASDWLFYALWSPEVHPYRIYFLVAHLISLTLGIVGVGGRAMLVLSYFLTVNVLNLNLSMLDGGHNLGVLLFLIMLLMNTTGSAPRNDTLWTRIIITLSNTAFFIARLQLITVYLSAVLHKLQGHLWTRGVALYYILQNDEFKHPYWSRVITQSDAMVAIGTYATLLFQALYPTLVWMKKGRPLILIVVAGFHISTIYLMGLTTFGVLMLIANFLFFKEEWTCAGLKLLNDVYTECLQGLFVKLNYKRSKL